jgi:hypothetical protein
MQVKEEFFSRGNFKIGNRQRTRFWKGTWVGDAPLSNQYPDLYSIVHRKQVLVANALYHSPLNITFRRTLRGNKWTRWLHLMNRLMNILLYIKSMGFAELRAFWLCFGYCRCAVVHIRLIQQCHDMVLLFIERPIHRWNATCLRLSVRSIWLGPAHVHSLSRQSGGQSGRKSNTHYSQHPSGVIIFLHLSSFHLFSPKTHSHGRR